MTVSEYITFVSAGALAIGMIVFICGKNGGMLCKITAALTFIAILLTPLGKIDTNAADIIKPEYEKSQQIAQKALEQSRELQSSAAAAKIAEYVEQRALAYGIEIEVKISAFADEDNNFGIKSAYVEYRNQQSYLKKQEIEKILISECGIVESAQQHVFNCAQNQKG